MGYDYEIVYKKGVENQVADALSRYATLHAISMPVHKWVEEIVKEVANNPYTVHIMDEIMAGSSAYPNFTLHNGQLLYKGRLVLAPDSKGKVTVLRQYHDSKEGGMQGISRLIGAFIEIFGGKE